MASYHMTVIICRLCVCSMSYNLLASYYECNFCSTGCEHHFVFLHYIVLYPIKLACTQFVIALVLSAVTLPTQYK